VLPVVCSSARIGPEQVHRHEHVAGDPRRGPQRVGDEQAADSHELAAFVEEAGAAVVGHRRAGEHGGLDVVLQ